MRRPLVLACILFAGILFLVMQVNPLWWSKQQELPEETMVVRGRVIDKEYKYSDEKFVLILYLDECELVSQHASVSFQLMCYLDEQCSTFGELIAFENRTEGGIPLGGWITLSGKMRGFESASNKGQFDAKRYYQILGIGGRMFSCKIQEYSMQASGLTQKWFRLRNTLYQKKKSAELLLYALMREEDASVMSSLLLGQKTLLDSETKGLYKQSGIIHILAISGLHISLLGMSIFKAFRKIGVPPLISGTISTIFVFLYGTMVGFGPSSLRAVIMFALQMLAYALGRTYDLLTELSAAAIIILFMEPLFLYHSGFILSFASVASMALLVPAFESLFPSKLRAGTSIVLGTLPVHGLFYFQIAPYSLLLNLVVVPCIAVVILLGILLLLVGAVSLSGAQIPAALSAWILHAFSRVSSFTLSLPGRQWIIGKPSYLQVILYLTALVIVCLCARKMPRIWNYLLLLLGIGVLCRNWQWGLQVSFLDVGQGDGIYVTDHRGTDILIDGGSSSVKQVGSYRMLPFLKSCGVSSLDTVFISHLDEDHYNGILELIELSDEEGVGIDAIYYTGLVTEEEREKETELQELTKRHAIQLKHLDAGMTYQKGKLCLECIYPEQEGHGESSNGNSMVLLLKYQQIMGLFTGDLEGTGELETEAIWEQRKLAHVDFLKVAHHGSKNSTSDSFLKKLQPKLAIISAGKDNRYGHPHEETLSRLRVGNAYVFRTDQDGMVTFRVKGRKVTLDTYCSSKVFRVK